MKLKESVFFASSQFKKKSVIRLVFFIIMLFLSLTKHQYTLSKKGNIGDSIVKYASIQK